MFNKAMNVVLTVNILKICFIIYYLPHYLITYSITDWLLEPLFLATLLVIRFGRVKLSEPIYQVISGTCIIYIGLFITLGHLHL